MTDKELTGFCPCCDEGPFTIPELNAHANICEVKRQKASECRKNQELGTFVKLVKMYQSLSEEYPATTKTIGGMRCV